MKKYMLITVVIIAVALLTVGIIAIHSRKDNKNKRATPNLPPLEVKGIIVKRGTITQYIEEIGVVQSEREAHYFSPINASVKKVNVDNGALVKKGDFILQLANKVERDKLEKAKVNLLRVRKKFEYALKHKWGDSTILRTTTGLDDAETNYYNAKKLYDMTKVYAPFSGIITNLSISEGSFVNTNEKLFDLIDNRHFKIIVNIPDVEIKGIKKGNKVIISKMISDEKFDGKVSNVVPIVDKKSKNVKILISTNHRFMIGSYLKVKIESGKFLNRIRVPNSAILYREGQYLVFKVKNGKAKWQWIKKGVEGENYTGISDGVSEGDTVITQGQYSISNDASVSVIVK